VAPPALDPGKWCSPVSHPGSAHCPCAVGSGRGADDAVVPFPRAADPNRTCGWVGGRRKRTRATGTSPAAYLTLNVHKAADLRQWAAAREWLTIYYLPPYAPDLNPVEGIWSLLRGGWLSNVAFSTPEHLDQRIRRGLRLIQYRSHLMDGCLAETGLTIGPA
jgi:hypothetical protein